VHHCVFSFACKAPGVGGAFGVCAIAPKLRGGVDFPGYIRDRPASQQMGMTLAVRGIPQHTFREVRFADLVFVAGRQCIPCFVEDGPQEFERRWIVCAAIAHGGVLQHISPRSA
jgi:hypothetical protein